MLLFTSYREKRLWTYTLIVLLAIFSTLIIGRPLAGMLRDSGLLSSGFWLAILLVGATILVNGLKKKPGGFEIIVWLGIAAVYLLVLLRMAVPEERSHLIEYGVLAVFVYEALRERAKKRPLPVPSLLAILVTTLVGMFDEGIQVLLPNRVFDWFDMMFNAIAGLMAIGSCLALSWVRKRVGKFL